MNTPFSQSPWLHLNGIHLLDYYCVYLPDSAGVRRYRGDVTLYDLVRNDERYRVDFAITRWPRVEVLADGSLQANVRHAIPYAIETRDLESARIVMEMAREPDFPAWRAGIAGEAELRR